MSRSFEERFHEKYERIPIAGCWIWTASLKHKGYGSISIDGRGGGQGAHRASWILHYGEIPPGMFVLHRCDVRCCVNPAHLFLGTNIDNVRDMMNKGRTRIPTEHPPRDAKGRWVSQSPPDNSD